MLALANRVGSRAGTEVADALADGALEADVGGGGPPEPRSNRITTAIAPTRTPAPAMVSQPGILPVSSRGSLRRRADDASAASMVGSTVGSATPACDDTGIRPAAVAAGSLPPQFWQKVRPATLAVPHVGQRRP